MTEQRVFFATNREELVRKGAVSGFGKQLNTRSPLWLRYGTANMRAPTRRGASYSVAKLAVAAEQIPGVTASTSATVRLGSTLVLDEVRVGLGASRSDVLLFIHGFSTTFDSALSHSAELATAYAPSPQTLEPACFSWPADGDVVPYLSYASDRDDGRASAKAVARALQRLLDYLRALDRRDWCGAKLHLVAHSMGCYVLRHALQALLSDFGERPLPRLFGQVFLMAADEDHDAFEHAHKLARLPELAEAVHVYYARNDRALVVSDLTKANPDRLGSTGPRMLTLLPHKVTLVDCSEVSATGSVRDAGHQYYRKRAEVLADVRAVLGGLEPDQIPNRQWQAQRACYRLRPNAGP